MLLLVNIKSIVELDCLENLVVSLMIWLRPTEFISAFREFLDLSLLLLKSILASPMMYVSW